MPLPPPTTHTTESISEELVVLDNKIKQLKFEYEQYFMGGRPREPVMLRGDVQKIVTRYSNTGIQNTALRFKFNNLCARYYALRRQWDGILKQIEEGTYKPHLFKAKLHERERGVEEPGALAATRRRVATRRPAAGPTCSRPTAGRGGSVATTRRASRARSSTSSSRSNAPPSRRSTAATTCASGWSSRPARRSSRRRP